MGILWGKFAGGSADRRSAAVEILERLNGFQPPFHAGSYAALIATLRPGSSVRQTAVPERDAVDNALQTVRCHRSALEDVVEQLKAAEAELLRTKKALQATKET